MRDLDPWGQMEIPFWEGVMLIFIVGFAIGWGVAVFFIYNGWFNPWK